MYFNFKKNHILLAFAALLGMAVLSPAYAGGLYVYVDDQGIPHYSLQKLDQRYQLFANGNSGLSDDVVLAVSKDDGMHAKLPNMGKYARNGAGFYSSGDMTIQSPSRAVLNHLLNSPSMARYEPLIIKYARKNGVDYNLVKAVMAAESGFNASAVSPKNAIGLMQVIGPTAARYGVTVDQLMIPERNIYAGVRYLADLSRMFKGRLDLIIAAYNAGEGAVYKYNRQVPPYAETQNYVRTVLSFYNVYSPSKTVNGGGMMLASEDGDLIPIPAAGRNSRRNAQRVKMRVSGAGISKAVKYE